MSDTLGPRLYVKPASLGSSIGTAPADDAASFARALAARSSTATRCSWSAASSGASSNAA